MRPWLILSAVLTALSAGLLVYGLSTRGGPAQDAPHLLVDATPGPQQRPGHDLAAPADEAALAAVPAEACPAGSQNYYSGVRDVNLCYPPAWKLFAGDDQVNNGLPPDALVYTELQKLDATGRRLATLSIELKGDADTSKNTNVTLWACDDSRQLRLGGPLIATFCFFKPCSSATDPSIVAGGSARLIGFEISATPPVYGGIELFATDSAQCDPAFDRTAQQEALTIVASIRQGRSR